MAFVMPKTVFASGATAEDSFFASGARGCSTKRDALYIFSRISSGYRIEDHFRGGHYLEITSLSYNQRALMFVFYTEDR